MRILRLRLCNLNSLFGEMEIDFTRPPFSLGGLFAITGQTGAGKTTLLDAITLALYGRVARYGNAASPETIMSRHTGEAWAEVDFACASGSYRSLWQRQRAHKKPDGKLQNPRRQVIALPSGEILTEKIPEAERKIPELTGLDYDRFLRSVLLAQGEFTSFLKADARARTELLQEVTGTVIYRDISEAAYKRADAARKSCELLLRDQQAVRILDEGTRSQTLLQLDEARRALATVQPELNRLSERLSQARRWQELDREREELAKATAAHEASLHAEAGPLSLLQTHERALPCQPALKDLDREQALQAAEQAALAKGQSALPGAQEALGKAQQDLAKARLLLEEGDRNHQAASSLWLEVEELDRQLAASAEAGRQLATQATEGVRRRDKAAKDLDGHLKLLATKRQAETAAQEWLGAHQADAGLAANLAPLQAALARWGAAAARHQELVTEGDHLRASLRTQAGTIAAAAAEAAKVEKALVEQRAQEAALRSRIAETAQGLPADRLDALIEENRLRREALLQLARDAAQLRTQSATLEQARQDEIQAGIALAEAVKTAEACRKQSDTVARLVDARRSALALAETLQSLEQHRAHLADGKPCPLCGAVHHPYASPEARPSAELGAARKALKEAEAEQYAAADSLSLAEKQEVSWAERHGRFRHELPRNFGHFSKAQEAWNHSAKLLQVTVPWSDETGLQALSDKNDHELTTRSALKSSLRILEKELGVLLSLVTETAAKAAKLEAEHQRLIGLEAQQRAQFGPLEEKLAESLRTQAGETRAFASLLPADLRAPDKHSEAAGCLEALRQRAGTHATHLEARNTLLTELKSMEASSEPLRQGLTEATASAAQLETELGKAREAHALKLAERRQRFADKKPAEEREQFARQLRQLNDAVTAALSREAAGRQALAALQQELSRLEQSLANRSQVLEQGTAELQQKAIEAGFDGLPSLRSALLEESRVTPLLALRRRLEEQGSALRVRRETLETRVTSLAPSAASDFAGMPELQRALAETEAARDEHNRQIGRLAQVINEDDAQRARQSAVLGQIEEANREQVRWQELSALIGSADGTSFARFAQGLTLDRLTVLANRHLSQLNPRYSMRRASGEAGENLALEIVDHYQADTTRPMSSLSGGESFLSSLALSLALSELAGGRTSIESLFIDEGFGSLDADTLEVAMSALENLQAQGKTIGVISHVESMKERIPIQIQVHKEPGGHSRLKLLPAQS